MLAIWAAATDLPTPATALTHRTVSALSSSSTQAVTWSNSHWRVPSTYRSLSAFRSGSKSMGSSSTRSCESSSAARTMGRLWW
ncbi:uncharacterized protein BJ171DRAFT_67453 [Polychytrium aggregatum]|uniref:uncharacterized protein n=1 Tax=Polychytrium aggregatum TaxID=110093 RepID=UPI0022FE75A9|nr:uncharacterized protein BJ171DRAFT_67453 [Polychytrium aggregatum]KAI9190690.1 hypothetical protein BJ171DRAFT_67453 [Polychytrium aggregatum]